MREDNNSLAGIDTKNLNSELDRVKSEFFVNKFNKTETEILNEINQLAKFLNLNPCNQIQDLYHIVHELSSVNEVTHNTRRQFGDLLSSFHRSLTNKKKSITQENNHYILQSYRNTYKFIINQNYLLIYSTELNNYLQYERAGFDSDLNSDLDKTISLVLAQIMDNILTEE